ncbi:MAG TPA: ATP-binding protein [bacterium]|nr:ATP-binding protein [bacterium]HPR87382.1 ATP-binding protein [bacterium]
MDSDLVRCELQADGAVRITPLGSLEDISLLPAVLAVFEREFRNKHLHFILDLGALSALPVGWVALVFELTARSRRRGGELIVACLQRKAQGDLLNFQPESYLCLEEMEITMPPEVRLAPEAAALTVTAAAAALPEAAAPAPSEPHLRRGWTENGEQVEVIDIPSRVDALYRACDFVLGIAGRLGYGEPDLARIKISVYEASLNAIEHAYHSDATRMVRVRVTIRPDRMIIGIIDHGDGFEASSNEDFDATAAAAARRTGGMGLHIIRRSMDKVTYLRDRKHGNCLVMEKKRPAATGTDEPLAAGPDAAAEWVGAAEENDGPWPGSSE